MKHLKVFLLLLLVAPSASAQTDSTKVQNDSITWSQELEGVTVKAQRQLIKQDIDRVGYVKRIEVITDPGAREDAEGVNAILNIVMMDGRSFFGVTGGVNSSYSTTKDLSINGNMTTQFGKALTLVISSIQTLVFAFSLSDSLWEPQTRRLVVDKHTAQQP